MNFTLGQLLYTSFPEIGFKLLTSQIPKGVQQFFLQQIVYQYWNPYNPPPSGYRGAYIYQISPEESLFGWIYNQGMDDLGRSHIPYFLCYYYPKLLESVALNKIFVCLKKGPVKLIENQKKQVKLDNIYLADLSKYESYDLGVEVPLSIRQKSQIALYQKQLINLFISSEEQNLSKIVRSDSVVKSYTNKQEVTDITQINRQTMNSNKIEDILRELASKPIGIQAAVLVSKEGDLITVPIGIDENSALIMAGVMLYLAKSTHEELYWQDIEKISVQAKEGHLILSSCGENVFLLVKTGQAMKGLIEGQINRTIKQLQIELQTSGMATIETNDAELEAEVFPQLNPPATNEIENEIRYRGRRPNF